MNCPLCCNTTFASKQSLLEHLTNALENVYCPVCNCKCTSLPHLVEHLAQDNCEPANNVHTIIFERQTNENNIENSSVIGNPQIKVYQNELHTDGTQFTTEQSYEAQVDPNDANKMYVELFSKQLKPCLQNREFKLVKENGESRYMILTQDETDLSAGNTIVTKQNIDGTISLTTIKDVNLDSGTFITPDTVQENHEVNKEESQEEIYSCNTCKVSFSSVMEHIQNYHNDQDVVVEEPMEEDQSESVPIEYETTMDSEDTSVTDKQAPRRVITDTGDIVEEPLVFKANDQVTAPDPLTSNQTQEPSKPGEGKLRVITKRLLQVDKLCDSVIKNAIQADGKDKSGPYHKVIVKEVRTESGFTIKMYQCLACEISVPNLEEFKLHPCKLLKYPCLYCPVAYENSKSLCAHMKAHKVRTEPIITAPILSYECSVCCTVFPTNKSLKLHKRMHDPVKSRPIEPPVENTDGSEVSEGRYRCTVCNKMIPNDYKTIHQNSHKTSEKMNCGICNKKFTSIEYLEMHTNVHNVDKAPLNNQDKNLPYSCLYCNRRFARPHEKVKHERIHTGEKPHSCEICGKSFRVSYCLTLHMRTHTGARPYACPHCGKRFKAHSVYNHHLLTHSEVRAYKCPYCPKAFKTSVQLAGHKNSHTKPFSCQHCNRPFASLYAVRVHTETHARQNNLKFSCELCGASYARAFALKDHIKQAHSAQEQAKPPSKTITEDEDWMIKENPDADGIPALNKDLTQEIDLEMSANELIVP